MLVTIELCTSQQNYSARSPQHTNITNKIAHECRILPHLMVYRQHLSNLTCIDYESDSIEVANNPNPNPRCKHRLTLENIEDWTYTSVSSRKHTHGCRCHPYIQLPLNDDRSCRQR